jgi:adenylosuccinate lyase
MADSGEKLEQAEVRLAKAQAALDEVGKVLAAAEQAQAAADRAREAADHAHETLRKVNVVVPALVGLLCLVVLLSRRHRHD